jgi:hypothetical protein
MFGRRRLLLQGCSTLLLVLGLLGCAEDLTGPTPAVDDPAASNEERLPVDPGVVCRAQLTTEVLVRGEGYSPVPIDIPNDPRIALPTVKLVNGHALDGSAVEGATVVFSGDPDVTTNSGLLTWQSQEQLTLTVNQSISLPDGTTGALPVGLYDVLVQNPNGNEATRPMALAMVEKPSLAQAVPGIVCLAQGSRELMLEGGSYLEIEGALGELRVEGVEAPFAIEAVSNCTDIAHPNVSARTCSSASLTLGQNSIPDGYPTLVTKNPETAPCQSEETINLRVVPAPVIDRVEAPLACVAQADRTFVIEGQDFLSIDSVVPAVTVGGLAVTVQETGGCEELPTMGHAVERCTSLTILVPEDALEPGTPEVVVVNPDPAGCSASNAVALTIVPPPTVLEVIPALVCVAQGERVVDIVGTDFLTVDGTVPDVAFDATDVDASAILASECEPLSVDGLTVQRCARLTVTLAEELLPAGMPDVSVTNPIPAGCVDTKSGLLTVVDGPKIEDAVPALVCTDDGSRSVTITGTGFLQVGTELPAVTMDGVEVEVDALTNCEPMTTNGLTVQSCTTLDVTVPQGTLAAGDTVLVVQNPAPAGCSISDSIVITAPPSITLASASPGALCDDTGSYTVTVQGTGFLQVDGAGFTVTAAGQSVTPTNITGCSELDVNGLVASSCTSFTFDLDTNALEAGPVAISVQNPAPDGCALTSDAILAVTLPPTISNVVPDNVCSEVATVLTITGTNFASTSTVSAGGVSASSVTVTSSTELVATWNAGLPAGTHDITVSNGTGCTATLSGGLVVDPTPIVFFVKPQVLYNGITISATIFTAGLSATAAEIWLVHENGTETQILNFSSPLRPNRIVAEIPAGLNPGSYEVRVTSALGCVGGLPGALTVTDTLTLALDPIKPLDPAFGSPTEPTAVTVFADTASSVTFEPGAIVYLSPIAGGTASELGAVVVDDQNPYQLSAVIPAGLDPGLYDLIVVNPQGEVGLATSAVTITVGEPPIITAVVPNSFANTTNEPGTIYGENFDTANGVSGNLICSDGTTTTTRTITIGTVTSTSVAATFPSSGLTAGSVCLVEVINNGDGASFEYSAVSVRNPAQNLFPWTAASTTMVEARRGLGLEAARPTNTSRYVYAIGGDSGSSATAKTSVEATPSDVFGNLGTWALQRNSLPAARTFGATTRIGSFLYLVGGHNGTEAQNTLLRAQVLDPLAGPEILDLDATLGDGTVGMPGGLWLYRVAAIFPSTDASNPSGESLAGDVFNVQLPDDPRKIVLTVSWEEVPGASGYRLYRTPAAGGSVSELELLKEITCGDKVCVCGVDISCKYADDNQQATIPGATPLPTGALGKWHALTGSTLSVPREGHAAVAIPNPNPSQPNQYYLYALGGRNASGTLLSSYEWARVTIGSDGSQSVSAWTTGSRTIGAAKADLGAWAVTNRDSSFVSASQAYVFVGMGATSTVFSTEIRSGSVSSSSTTGDLVAAAAAGVLDAETAMNNARAGSVCEVGGGFLYVFGGSQAAGTLAASDWSSKILAGPDLNNWDSLAGGSLKTARTYAASTAESAFYYVAGGSTLANGTNATNSVERTVQ